MERDETFVPKTRSERGLPPAHETVAQEAIHESAGSKMEAMADLLEDSPLYNLLELVIQQSIGWPLYIIFYVSGQNYGRWTNRALAGTVPRVGY